MVYTCKTFDFVLSDTTDWPVIITYTVFVNGSGKLVHFSDMLHNPEVDPYFHDLKVLADSAPETLQSMYVHMLNGFRRLDDFMHEPKRFTFGIRGWL